MLSGKNGEATTAINALKIITVRGIILVKVILMFKVLLKTLLGTLKSNW